MTIAMRRAVGAEAVSDPLEVACYRGPWRAIVAGLVVASRASVPLILARVVFVTDPEATLPLLIGLIVTMVLLPGGLAAVLRRSFAARMTVEDGVIVITRRDVRIEIPANAVVAVVPWTLPLPTPGASLRLRSGAPFAGGLGLGVPSRLVTFLAERAGAGAQTVHDDPAFRHAAARDRSGLLRWWQWLVKFPLFGLLPTGVLFNAHQWIAYGGTLGQYYMFGARPYLFTFLEYWTTVTIYLALWAGAWRVAAEIVAWSAARLAPATATGVRRFVEVVCRVLYYGGVPAMLALRFAS
jgi:hypothetical protein